MNKFKNVLLFPVYVLYLVAALLIGIGMSFYEFLKKVYYEIKYFCQGFTPEEYKSWRKTWL